VINKIINGMQFGQILVYIVRDGVQLIYGTFRFMFIFYFWHAIWTRRLVYYTYIIILIIHSSYFIHQLYNIIICYIVYDCEIKK